MTNKDIKEKAREMFETTLFRWVDLEDGNGKYFYHKDVENVIDQIIDLAIAERDKKIVNKILRKRSCKSHEPENCNICMGRQEALDIINLIN